MTKRLTQEEFENRVKQRSGKEYTVLGEYLGSNIPVLMRHEVCGHKWKIRPSNFLNLGQKCSWCSWQSRSLSQRDFKNKIQKQGDGQYLPLEKYQGARVPIWMKHKKCSYQWKISPGNFFGGKRCPLCAGNAKKDTATFVKEVESLDNNYKVLGEYKNNQGKIEMLHNKCGNTFKIIPRNFLQGNRCPFCFGMPKIDTEHYIEEVKNIDVNYKVLGEYKGRHEKLDMFHLKCGKSFKMRPNDFLGGERCPHCNQSHGEHDVAQFLKEHSIEYEFQKRFEDCVDKKILPFDFYIPSMKYCIEFDGIQHFKPVEFFGGEVGLEGVQRRDNIKTAYCKSKGIKLSRIRYDEDVEEKMNSIL
ncbi:hypothetical protein LQF60_02925 [Tetragenococcus koreensis]|uniref:hypothetical protein n=1 Tax=Tetragenococcus koreensis TaxID=290335 RepID=UPI001F25BDED|nr:hypothetical protein [Tetragenococcus koreensis]MCF1585233.1 hypothetical protein [Tetragenococcus koreensis]MCF1628791.1 hypothetical protein [Tetragenococcus koreensis]